MRLLPGNRLSKRGRFFDDFWAPMRWDDEDMEGFFAPKVDVKECEGHYEILAELPGVAKDDIKVSLHDGVLMLEAEAKQEDKEEKDGKIIRQERRYGKLVRSFDVGPDVSEDDVEAEFKDGVLKLKAPKREHVVPEKRQISIN